MKFLLVSLLSVLAISCADFESESFNQGIENDADKFEKMSGNKFSYEDASKQLFLTVNSSKNIVVIDIFKEVNGSRIDIEKTTFTCSTGCISEVASDNTYKAVSTNIHSNEVVITKINKETNKSIYTQRFELVRQ